MALAVILWFAYTIHVVTRWRSLREYSDIHGSARWAKRSEIKQAGTSLLSSHMRKLIALVVITLITSWILFGHRLVANRTHSLPVELYYWINVPIKKGSIVLFKPDQSTPLQQLGINRGYEARKLPLLKRVVALAGDVVSVSSSGVSINGQHLPNSAPLLDDEDGRSLTDGTVDHAHMAA